MSSLGGPNIITDRLALHLDAANIKSYPGSGTTWVDKSGNGNNFTLANGPTYANGVLTFDGTDDKATCVNTTFGNFGTGSFTLEYVVNTSGVGSNIYGVTIMKRSVTTTIGGANRNGWCDRTQADRFFVQDNNPAGNTAIIIQNSYVTPKNQITHITHVVSKDATGKIASGSTYNNGILVASSSTTFVGNGSVDNGNPTTLMFSTGELGSLSGKLYVVRAYQKELSPQEVLQNYNATKSRFNL